MRNHVVRWVLAVDAGCAHCRRLSQRVATACNGALEVLPLRHPDVARWAELAHPGRELDWTPTLFRVEGDRVRVWTGRGMSLRLARHLGARKTVRVLRALGTVAPPAQDTTMDPGSPHSARRTTRRRFLQIGAGGVIAAGILVTGAVPAAADPVASWIKRNAGRLPRTYSQIAALPAEYRSAVWAELTPAERSAAWVAHLESYQQSLQPTGEQAAVLQESLVLAADPANFLGGEPAIGSEQLSERGIAAFGLATAGAIFAMLGPAYGSSAVAFASCGCSTASDYCGGHCQGGGCTVLSSGCGFLYQYACNGRCV